jgi:hypothetical protein
MPFWFVALAFLPPEFAAFQIKKWAGEAITPPAIIRK